MTILDADRIEGYPLMEFCVENKLNLDAWLDTLRQRAKPVKSIELYRVKGMVVMVLKLSEYATIKPFTVPGITLILTDVEPAPYSPDPCPTCTAALWKD